MVNAFATEFSGDEPTAGENADPRDLRMPDGVGILEGTFECNEAERSRRAATGDVNGL
jgi:hypothetical protein